MQIFFPKEEDHEIRATILPEVAKKFTDLGIEVLINLGWEKKSLFLMNNMLMQVQLFVMKKKKGLDQPMWFVK